MGCRPSAICLLPISALVAEWYGLVSSTLVNVTVDDQGADPTSKYGVSYSPPWGIGQNCSGDCEARADPRKAHDGTWSDMTYDPSIAKRAIPQNATFDFTGSAIYVYGIQSQSTTDPVSQADIVFYIDGARVGNYKFTPNSTLDAYTYNQLLFTAEGLGHASHVVEIQNGQFGGPISLILLDYLVYTTDDTSKASVPVFSLSADISSGYTASALGSPASTQSSSGRAAIQTPSSRAPTSQSSHGLSSAARTAIIAISAALGSLSLVFVVWLTRRRRYQTPSRPSVYIDSPFDTATIYPQTANVYTVVQLEPSPPSYSAVCAPQDAALPAVNIDPVADELRGHTQSLLVGSSVQPETTLPIYKSEAGTASEVVQPT